MVLTPDAWQGSILTDYSVVEEVYLRMWGEHGKGPWASQQGSNQPERTWQGTVSWSTRRQSVKTETLPKSSPGRAGESGRHGAVLAATPGDKAWCLMPRVGVPVLQAEDGGRKLKVV